MSTFLPIRTAHLCYSRHLKNHENRPPLALSPPLSLKLTQSGFGSSYLRFRDGSRFLHRNGVLARAEDKAKDSNSSSSSSTQQQPPQPNSENKQFQVPSLIPNLINYF